MGRGGVKIFCVVGVVTSALCERRAVRGFNHIIAHLAPVVIAFYLIFLQICVLCTPVVSQYQKSGDERPS